MNAITFQRVAVRHRHLSKNNLCIVKDTTTEITMIKNVYLRGPHLSDIEITYLSLKSVDGCDGKSYA